MGPRRGVSTFVEVFLLVGVAVGGSALVYTAALGYGSSASGPSMEIQDATMRQGPSSATLRMVVANTGGGTLSGFNVYFSPGPQYCEIVSDRASGTTLTGTCPSLAGTIPASLAFSLNPGSEAVVVFIFPGGSVFSVGSAFFGSMISGGATGSFSAVVVPG